MRIYRVLASVMSMGIVFMIFSCSSTKTKSSKVQVIEVPEHVQKSDDDTFFDAVEGVQLTPLKFGFPNPDYLPSELFKGEYIYGREWLKGEIRVFDENGDQVNIITEWRGTNIERLFPLAVQLDDNGELLVFARKDDLHAMRRFTASGERIGDYDISNEGLNDLSYIDIHWFSENHFFVWQRANEKMIGKKGRNYHLHEFKDGELVNSNLEIFGSNLPREWFLQSYGNAYLMPTFYNNYVYKVDEQGYSRAFKIDFGDANVKLDELTKGVDPKLRKKNFETLLEYSFLTGSFMNLKEYVFFVFAGDKKERYALYKPSTKAFFTIPGREAIVDGQVPFKIVGYDQKENKLLGLISPGKLNEHLESAGVALKEGRLLKAADIQLLEESRASGTPVLMSFDLK